MDEMILDFWDSQAEKYGSSHVASWGDQYAINLEIDVIGQYIHEDNIVLDVGCANGHATLRHLEKGVASIVGVDFSPVMIQEANKAALTQCSPGNVCFQVGDVRHLEFDDQQFDVVYTTRTLINLPTWNEQQQGIMECLRVCKPGGRVIFSEAFWEPLVLLNAFRSLKSLPPLVEHDYNRYLKKSRLDQFLNSVNISFDVIDFSSIYYLGSRFLRELVTDAAAYPGYSNPINEIFYQIEKQYSGGGFGIQQAYVIKKRG